MQIAYPDLRRALQRRGWVETCERDIHYDLKFTLQSSDIVFHSLRKHQIINHNRGDGNITCKSGLIDTLSENSAFWISWLDQEMHAIKGLEYGVDAFFPKSFILTGGKDFHLF